MRASAHQFFKCVGVYMSGVIQEFVRNQAGYFLVIVGMFSIWLGGHTGYSGLSKAGDGLVTAALLAFQLRRTPQDTQDSNTSTTTTTTSVPKPDTPPTPIPATVEPKTD